MKIQGPKQTGGVSSAKKTSKPSSAGGGFGDFMSAGSAVETNSAAPPQSMTAVGALFAVQATEDPTEKATQRRMTMRADNVLEELDQLYMAVLRGNVSMNHMVNIADMVSKHREKVIDKDLSDLLDEIDLRAQIELAKMRKALDKTGKTPY